MPFGLYGYGGGDDSSHKQNKDDNDPGWADNIGGGVGGLIGWLLGGFPGAGVGKWAGREIGERWDDVRDFFGRLNQNEGQPPVAWSDVEDFWNNRSYSGGGSAEGYANSPGGRLGGGGVGPGPGPKGTGEGTFNRGGSPMPGGSGMPTGGGSSRGQFLNGMPGAGAFGVGSLMDYYNRQFGAGSPFEFFMQRAHENYLNQVLDSTAPPPPGSSPTSSPAPKSGLKNTSMPGSKSKKPTDDEAEKRRRRGDRPTTRLFGSQN